MPVAPVPDERLGFLRSCLVEGDPAQEARLRHRKQRALVISIIIQLLVVAAIVIFPLFTKGENIATRVLTFPAVPYSRGASHPRQPNTQPAPQVRHPVCSFCRQPDRIPTGIVIHDHQPIADPGEIATTGMVGVPQGDPNGIPIDFLGLNNRASTNVEIVQPPHTPKRIRVGTIEPAMLLRRIEPRYPALAQQTRQEGRVELRAIISTDGTVQSLEVISGHPLFIQSALAAVREWRYRPTILNGQPVEVETHITVVYTLSH